MISIHPQSLFATDKKISTGKINKIFMSPHTFQKTFRLFSRPSFFEGIARLIDFKNTLNKYNESETSAEADLIALKNDWYTVGDDLRCSISMYKQKSNAAKK